MVSIRINPFFSNKTACRRDLLLAAVGFIFAFGFVVWLIYGIIKDFQLARVGLFASKWKMARRGVHGRHQLSTNIIGESK